MDAAGHHVCAHRQPRGLYRMRCLIARDMEEVTAEVTIETVIVLVAQLMCRTYDG